MPRQESLLPHKPKMVNLLPDSAMSGNTRRFGIAVEGERFRNIVSGHAVRRRPLCPASVYLECVAMAIDILEGDLQMFHLEFESLDIQAPLGVGAVNVEVTLQELDAHKRWEFAITSRHEPRLNKVTLHAKGRATKSTGPRLDTMARLLAKKMQTLPANEGVERILSRRAYDLFSRVVTYEKFLRGITSISICDVEATAKITIPDNQPGLNESTLAGMFDAVSMDNFIQVVGLLINTSDMVGENDVMVCTGIESSITSKNCNMVASKSWKVYACYTPTTPSQAIGDVFAFAEDGSIAAAFIGCRFAKLDMTRLERVLDSANRAPSSKQSQKVEKDSFSNSSVLPSIRTPELVPDSSTSPSTGDEKETPTSTRENNLRDIFEMYTGTVASTILGDTVIADLGLDSLAATEMAAELQSSYQTSIESQDLLSMTVQQLETLLYGETVRKHPASLRKPPETLSRSRNSIQSMPNALESKLMQLLTEITGIPASSIQALSTLDELGVDSLALTEIMSSIADDSQVELNIDGISLQSRVEEVLVTLGVVGNSKEINKPRAATVPAPLNSAIPKGVPHPPPPELLVPAVETDIRIKTDPVAGLQLSNARFETSARNRGFEKYWQDVAINQDAMVLAFIVEAFNKLGVDFTLLKEGERVPNISHKSKHSNLVQRLWIILEKHAIVKGDYGTIVRGSQPVSTQSSYDLHDEFLRQHAPYAIEARLLNMTGSKLAECLTGTVDPIRLLFGTTSAMHILEEYYGNSPMLSTLTDQLVSFVMGSLEKTNVIQEVPLRILEVGGGTGGTTSRMVESLAASGLRVEYTFSDVSSTMISKAKKRFIQYSWMKFKKLDLEQCPPTEMQAMFDIIIGTNCVHATSNKVATTSHLRDMLNSNGFIVLSEVTRIIDWYDLVFGLLEGWWLADGGFTYPLQPAESWMVVFRQAGFPSVMFSKGTSEDANTQQLLIGCNHHVKDLSDDGSMKPAFPLPMKQTLVYKQVDGLHIEADIFLPARPPAKAMPIALMLHGGGHITLSRKATRPAQSAHLLTNGVLPISLDYRLCPEVNLIDGAMTDVRDAFTWARSTLPSLLRSKGIEVDADRIVIIGFSSGGHLAMSSAWTVAAAGEAPPKAILSFYAPVDFTSQDAFSSRTPPAPQRMSKEQIMKTTMASPISNHDICGSGSPELGWVRSGDLRSELLLSLFKESKEYGLSLLLNGLPGTQGTIEKLFVETPSLERQAAICPTSQSMAGNYKTPTYIIHGKKDDIASFEAAANFYEELERQGINSGFLGLEEACHIHDLLLKPGMPEWDEQVAPGYQFLFDALEI